MSSVPQGNRNGKWTQEEEQFVNKCLVEFGKGELKDCEEGCTLLTYLSRKLNCDPKRISDNFASSQPPPVASGTPVPMHSYGLYPVDAPSYGDGNKRKYPYDPTPYPMSAHLHHQQSPYPSSSVMMPPYGLSGPSVQSYGGQYYDPMAINGGAVNISVMSGGYRGYDPPPSLQMSDSSSVSSSIVSQPNKVQNRRTDSSNGGSQVKQEASANTVGASPARGGINPAVALTTSSVQPIAADGTVTTTSTTATSTTSPLMAGMAVAAWTVEQNALCAKLIGEFESGLLTGVEEGSTLDAFLERRLRMDPAVIAEKFTGRYCGKLVYIARSSLPSLPKNVSNTLLNTLIGGTSVASTLMCMNLLAAPSPEVSGALEAAQIDTVCLQRLLEARLAIEKSIDAVLRNVRRQ